MENYKELVEQMKKGCEDCEYRAECQDDETMECTHRLRTATAITELLARADAAESALKREKSYDTPLPPFDEDDPDLLYCQKCGSGEYLENEDGNRNNYCGQCGQRIDWEAYDAAIEDLGGAVVG